MSEANANLISTKQQLVFRFLGNVKRRLIRSPFLYLSFIVVLALGSGIFCWQKNQNPLGVFYNIFDENQYLFASQNKIAQNFNFNISEQAFLSGQAPTFLAEGFVLAVATADILESQALPEVEEYVVQEGDTLGYLAQKFSISLETIAWANSISTTAKIKPGQKLLILPVPGVFHLVQEGDTVSELAKIYKAKQSDILDFNRLDGQASIFAGDFLIVPDGTKPKNPPVQYRQVALPQSYFICPIPSPCIITQGLHWYNAIDISNGKCGDPVYAAASGVVQKTGYGAVGGYYVLISHPNGAVTYYGHLSRITAKKGQQAYQGKIIGYVGYTGKTIPNGPAGCHVHFEVRFAANPFAKYAVGSAVAK